MKFTIKTRYALPIGSKTLEEKIPDLILLAYMTFVYIWNYSIGFSGAIKYGIHFSVAAIFFLLAIFKLKCFLMTSFEKIFLLFIAFCAISIPFALNPSDALSRCETLTIYFIILTLIHIYVVKENKLEWLIFALCFAGIALAIYNFYFYGVGTYLEKLASGKRVGGEIMNVNVIGKFCSFSAIICFWYATYKNKIWYYAPMILCTFIALGVGSRKSLSALILGCCMLYLCKGSLRQKLKGVVMVILFLSAFVMILQLPIFERTAQRFEGFVAIFSDSDRVQDTDHSTYLRTLLIKHGLEDFKDSPLMGVGINNAHYLGIKYTGYDFYMHNNYVELLVSIGIIGAVIYYLLLFYPLIKLFRPALNHDGTAILLEVFLVLNLILDVGQVTYANIDNYFLILAAHVKARQLRLQGT